MGSVPHHAGDDWGNCISGAPWHIWRQCNPSRSPLPSIVLCAPAWEEIALVLQFGTLWLECLAWLCSSTCYALPLSCSAQLSIDAWIDFQSSSTLLSLKKFFFFLPTLLLHQATQTWLHVHSTGDVLESDLFGARWEIWRQPCQPVSSPQCYHVCIPLGRDCASLAALGVS